MNEFTKDRPTSEQLVELLDSEPDITICSDVVHGLDYEYKELKKENQELRGQLIEKNISEAELKDKLVKERERINNLVDSLNLRINGYLRDKKCLIDNKTNPIKIKTEPYNSRSKMPLEVVSVYIEPITLEFIQERLDDTK